jgi:hypothetical protein
MNAHQPIRSWSFHCTRVCDLVWCCVADRAQRLAAAGLAGPVSASPTSAVVPAQAVLVGSGVGVGLDAGVRTHCCQTVRHVAEDPQGLAVAARALVDLGEIMLFVLGTQVTADMLVRWLRPDADAEAGAERVAQALVVLEKLLATADGPVALWNCLHATVALIDLAINDGKIRVPGTHTHASSWVDVYRVYAASSHRCCTMVSI